MLPKKRVCVYHSSCTDGFGGAMCVQRYWAEHPYECDVYFHAATYGSEPPDVTDAEVYIVDFSYPKAVLKEMLDKCARLTIIDHHKTAIEDLLNFEHTKLTKVLDKTYSGTVLAFKYLFPTESVIPRALLHIQDRDLWHRSMIGTDEVCAALHSLPFDFDVWRQYGFWDSDVANLYKEGVALTRSRNKMINEATKQPPRMAIIGGYKVSCLNTHHSISSEVAGFLAQNAPFGATYYDKGDKRYFSLRSTQTGADVAAIASLYGGGGHKQAAGFSVVIGPDIGEISWEK